MPVTVFLSYRRRSGHPAARLYEELAHRFGHHNVFEDVESIGGGTDYVVALQRALAASDVLVAPN